MPQKALVSVVMPLFYSGSVLKQTLEALYRVDYPKRDMDIIFSYYPSKDSTLEVIEEFKLQHEGEYFDIKVLECDERGVSYGRNLGIKSSTGEYIFLLDDDVAIHKDTFKHVLNILTNEPNVAVVGAPYAFSKPSIVDKAFLFRFEGHVVKSKSFPTGCAMIRKKVFYEVGLFDERLGPPYSSHEDLEMSARIKRKGYDIVRDERITQKHLPKRRRYAGTSNAHNPQLQTLRYAINLLRSYFTGGADSYHFVLSSAPITWKLELIAHFLMPLPFLIAEVLNFYFIGAVYLLALATSTIVYYRAFKPQTIYLPFVVLLARIARSYGYLSRRMVLKLLWVINNVRGIH